MVLHVYVRIRGKVGKLQIFAIQRLGKSLSFCFPGGAV